MFESSGFRSQLQESSVFSHTKELGYNETVCLWLAIYTCVWRHMYRNFANTYQVYFRVCVLKRYFKAWFGRIIDIPTHKHTDAHNTHIYHHHHQVALAALIFRDSLSIRPYHASLTAGPPNYILCPHNSCCSVNTGTSIYMVYRRMLLISSSLLLVSLTWIFYEMGGNWQYSYCFVGDGAYWIYSR